MMSDVVSAKILKVLEALLVVRLLLLRVNSVALHQVQDVAGRGRGEHCRLRMVVGKHCRLEEKSRLIRCAYPAGQKTVREVYFTVFLASKFRFIFGSNSGINHKQECYMDILTWVTAAGEGAGCMAYLTRCCWLPKWG